MKIIMQQIRLFIESAGMHAALMKYSCFIMANIA